MTKLYLLFLFLNLSHCIPTVQLATRQAENETNIINEDFKFSEIESDVKNFTNPSTGCTGEFWQPTSHEGRPVSLKF